MAKRAIVLLSGGLDSSMVLVQALRDGCEVAALTELGHITKAQIEKMYVDDIPPTQWRLACQMIIRDEDILVEYPSK